MKKWVKVTIIVISTLVVLVGLAALLVSPVAKYYIEKNSKELIGRQVKMKSLHINLFTGSLEIDSLRMYEKNDKQVFASVDSFEMNLELAKLISKDIEVKNIRVIRPYANIWQKGDLFNFSDLMKEDSTQNQDTTTSDFPHAIILKNIYVQGGNLVYTDKLLNNTLNFKDLGVSIPELQFGTGDTKAGIHLKIGDMATLDSHLNMDMKTNDFTLSLDIKKLPISIIKPYLKSYYDINKLGGLFNANLKLAGNSDHIMDFILTGKMAINDIDITNKYDEPVVEKGDFAADIKKIDMTHSQYLFNSILFSNMTLSYILHPKTDNITSLFPATTETAADSTSTEPMKFTVDQLDITNSALKYTDMTLRKPMHLNLRDVGFHAENFDMDGWNQLKGNASFENNGRLMFTWKGNMNDLSTQDIAMKIVNFDLKNISPYCYEYTAYDLTNGRMSFETKNAIKNNYINSTNVVDVYKVDVSKKHKEFKPEYNLPLRTALYILKDKDDKINFLIPVKGNINDPEFKYWRIVMKTLGNLMIKVAVAPFKFLGSSLGLNGQENMDQIPFEELRRDFTTEDYTKIDELLSTLSAKPELSVKLTQYINLNQDNLDKYGLFCAKEKYMNAHNTSTTNVPLSYDEVNDFDQSNPQFITYINQLTASQTDSSAALKDKIKILYPVDSLKTMLINKMNFRNGLIRKYMIESGKIKPEKLSVVSAQSDSLKSFTDKAQFKVKIGMDGDD